MATAREAAWREARDVFDEVVDLDPVRRGERLAAIGDVDPALRRAVETLLVGDSEADARLGRLEAALGTTPGFVHIARAIAERYRIERELGSGGMATVYLAEDVRHCRKVALKVLHPELAAVLGNERLLAEIRTTATLQHPNILPLFDSGTVDGVVYYVMPYVAGESLRDRLDREGPLPVDTAVKIATAVADALEYAHRQGVVHRDIKPGNILLKDGHALVADFGIALAASNAGGSRLTQTGLLVGTPQYMSPEQASSDHAPDGRSDIYSLGAVCYEMLAGEPPISATTTRALLVKLLADEPRPLSSLRKAVPSAVEAAVHRALEKLPGDRWGSAAEFAASLTRPDSRGIPWPLTRRAGRNSAALIAVIVAVALATFVAGVFAGRGIWPGAVYPAANLVPVRHWSLFLPDSARFSPTTDESTARRHGLAVSSDAAHIAYVGVRGATTALYVIDQATGTSLALDDTERARLPAFSPDGRWLAFIANGKLLKVSVDGGAVMLLAQLEAPTGLFWLSDDELLVSQSAIGPGTVPSTGGRFKSLGQHFGGISVVHTQVLPGDKELLGTTAFGDLVTVSRETGAIRMITTGEATGTHRAVFGRALRGNHPRYLSTGYLVYASGSSLMGVPFDPKRGRATGKPTPVVTGIRSEGGPGEAQFAVSDDGTVVYVPGVDGSLGQLVWSDHKGTLGDTLPLPPSHLLWVRLSRDGGKLAIAERMPNGTAETRIVNLRRRAEERVRVGGEIGVTAWSADGRTLIGYQVSDTAPGRACCFRGVELDAGSLALRPSTVRAPYRIEVELDESPDGAFRCAEAMLGNVAGREIYGPLLRRVDDAAPPRILGEGHPGDCAFSPDGKWVAFTSRDGLYVTRATVDSNASLVKLAPATAAARWTPDGRRILYHDGRRLFAVDVQSDVASVKGGEPRFLFQNDGLATTWDVWGTGWDVAPNDRLLLWQPQAQGPSGRLDVITNFPALVARRVDSGLTTR